MLVVLMWVAEAAGVIYWIVAFSTGQKIGPPIDVPFFVLLFGCGMASMCAKILHDLAQERPEEVPSWLYQNYTFFAANVPIYWADMAVIIYGFFILPWYTVLICCAIDTFAGALFHSIFLRRLPHVIALFVSYLMMGTAIVWYFGFVRHSPTAKPITVVAATPAPTPQWTPTPAPEWTPTPDLSRVKPFIEIPALIKKSRQDWLKVLGKPHKSRPIKNDGLRSLDSWKRGSVELIVTWNEGLKPVFIQFATPKGTPVLSLEESKTLAGYFGLTTMYPLTGASRNSHRWGSENSPIKANTVGSDSGLVVSIDSNLLPP